jgi:hypothetical protein
MKCSTDRIRSADCSSATHVCQSSADGEGDDDDDDDDDDDGAVKRH